MIKVNYIRGSLLTATFDFSQPTGFLARAKKEFDSQLSEFERSGDIKTITPVYNNGELVCLMLTIEE
jgi:hypothetical protein